MDQPPLAPLFTRVAVAVFGFSPIGLRLFPVLAGTGVVVGAAATARRLGGGRYAQVVAAGAMACAPVLLAGALLGRRAIVLDAAYAAHPERFVNKRPAPPELPGVAWINKPQPQDGAQNNS